MLRIVTDSTSYLPANVLARYDIRVIPLKVQLGFESYAETSDLSNREFFNRLATTPDFPTTSQPSSGEFQAVYRQILSQDPEAEILVLAVSSKLSGTYNGALAAAAEFARNSITVFDSLSVAMGLGIMVITAAKMAEAGRSLASVLARLEQMRREISIVLMVDTLEYLRRGGRLGPAAAFLGTLLGTKPLLAVREGRVEPLERVRTHSRALARLLTELERKLGRPDQPVQAAVMHVAARAEMEKLAAMMTERFNITHLYTSELGPVVAAHLGPGALGAGICPDLPLPEEAPREAGTHA